VVGGRFVFSDPRHSITPGTPIRGIGFNTADAIAAAPIGGYTVKEADTGAAGLGAGVQMQPNVIVQAPKWSGQPKATDGLLFS
jgi:hypothetical protein